MANKRRVPIMIMRGLILVLVVVFSSGVGGVALLSDQVWAQPKSTLVEGPMAKEISFLSVHGGIQGEVVKQLISAYEQAQSRVKVTFISVPGSYENLLERLQAMVVAGDPPAVAQAGLNYTQFMSQYMPIVPIEDFAKADGYDLKDFFSNMLNLSKDNSGRLVGLPFGVSTPVLYYNADLFRRAGLNPDQPPRTWDEVTAYGKKITALGEDTFGVWYGYTITGNWVFQAMMESAGGHMTNAAGNQVFFNSEAGQRALQTWVDWVHRDKIFPFTGQVQNQQMFFAGKVGMVVWTTASLTDFRTSANFDLRTGLFPIDGSKPRRVPAGGNSLFIMKVSPEQQRAAWDFVKFATSAEGTSIIAKGMGYMATRGTAVGTQSLMGEYLARDANASRTYQQLPNMVRWYNLAGRSGPKVVQILQDNIVAALNGQKTVKQALDDATNEANRLLH